MGPGMVVVNREVPGIPPVLVEGGCDGGGFVELLAPGVLAPPDAAILFGTAWLDDLYGHASLLEGFLEGVAELGAGVGRASWMTTGKVSRVRLKAARMLCTEGEPKITLLMVSAAVGQPSRYCTNLAAT